MVSIKEKYIKEVIPVMAEKFGYKNKMSLPVIKKVTLNSSFGKMAVSKTGADLKKIKENILQDLSIISGQKPKMVRSKKSIAGFKLRAGIEVASVVTLRNKKMWDFLERLVYLSLPRTRDFKGIDPKSVDKNGNLNIGFKEHINFPEVFTEKEKTIMGLEVNVSTTCKSKEEALEFFKLMGFPIR